MLTVGVLTPRIGRDNAETCAIGEGVRMITPLGSLATWPVIVIRLPRTVENRKRELEGLQKLRAHTLGCGPGPGPSDLLPGLPPWNLGAIEVDSGVLAFPLSFQPIMVNGWPIALLELLAQPKHVPELGFVGG